MKEKTLTREEFLELELRHAKSNIIKLERENLKFQKEFMRAEKEILSYKFKEISSEIESKLSKLEDAELELASKYDKIKADREQYIENIRNKFNIEGRFGYDPDTLIIVED